MFLPIIQRNAQTPYHLWKNIVNFSYKSISERGHSDTLESNEAYLISDYSPQNSQQNSQYIHEPIITRKYVRIIYLNLAFQCWKNHNLQKQNRKPYIPKHSDQAHISSNYQSSKSLSIDTISKISQNQSKTNEENNHRALVSEINSQTQNFVSSEHPQQSDKQRIHRLETKMGSSIPQTNNLSSAKLGVF